MNTRESHKAIRKEWRRDKDRDAFRETWLDEERLRKLEKEEERCQHHR